MEMLYIYTTEYYSTVKNWNYELHREMGGDGDSYSRQETQTYKAMWCRFSLICRTIILGFFKNKSRYMNFCLIHRISPKGLPEF